MQSVLEQLPQDWRAAMEPFLDMETVASLSVFVESEYAQHTVYPPRAALFRAFKETPFDSVRAVILGQDPYHEQGQACGLAFAVGPDVKPPPSLRNILKEYADDLQVAPPTDRTPDIGVWARHGVLLLNTVLTVRAGAAASHHGHGWEMLTDAAIRALSARVSPVAFVLWGAPAGRKASLIDASRHIVLRSAHPSPLSAYRGFFGSRPFSRVNELLVEKGTAPVDWTLGD